ncbi:MAG TPA: DNA polymerase III subunit delta, partial [Hyphomicrobiaceae bacterium]|nr:DNA polymerase III subunit delta [Hyphomicrobiaceae bacterium]
KRLADKDDPPGEILRLDDTSLEEDPARIAVELQTMPMFGGRKIVRAIAGRRVTAAHLKPLVEGGDLQGALIVEAGNLRPDDALRTLFEKSSAAAAVACFPDEARDLEAIVREVLSASGLQITPDAKRLLLARLGADRALSRAEIDKLALYAHGKTVIEESDVEAAVGDAAEQALDRIVMAAGARRTAAALSEYDRSIAAGESSQSVIVALQRHFLRLHRMRGMLDAGRSMEDVIRSLRPQPHFKQRDALEQQCRAWTLTQLAAALARIAEAAKAARLSNALEGALAENLLLDIAQIGERQPPRPA